MQYKKAHIPDFRKVARAVQQSVDASGVPLIHEFGDAKAAEMTKMLHTGKFESQASIPVTPEVMAAKVKANGGWTPPLVSTGEYADSITATPREDGVIVAPNESQHGDSGTTNKELGGFLENGTDKVPARPHWQPFQEQVTAELGTLTKKISEAIVSGIRQRSGIR